LGGMTPSEQSGVRARIAGDAKLTEQDQALAAIFQALGTLRSAPAPSGLKQRVCAHVADAQRWPRLAQPADHVAQTVEESAIRVIRLGNLRDIVAVAAVVVLMVGIGVPSALHMRDRSQRMGCSANLAMVGQGLQRYAATFGDSLPFAGWNTQSSWRPTNAPSMVTLPNRRHVYPLLREAFVGEPRVFLCPSRSDVPMPADQVRQRSDFLESRNVSYSYFNMAGVRPSLKDDGNLPIMADDNPNFDDGVPLFEHLGFGHAAVRNSRAHGGAGQNILTLDGHVKWTSSPRAGLDGDNIWTLEGVDDYTGREGPKSPRDAHLIK
jgi:hypothetical protein